MPRVATKEVADLLTERLVNRGHEGSPQWIAAWCRRWGSQVANDTATNPLFQHVIVSDLQGEDEHVLIGPDKVPINIYREWKDLQDGSRMVRGMADGAVFWEG
jgi:hypothetical protein